SLSIENQRLLLDRYMLESDMDNGHVLEFVDNGYTGTNFERPAVQELLELVRDGKINCILVKDFSRFGRNALETGYFIERVFPLYRVRFISIDDGFDSFALDGDTGGMEVAFKFLINEYYSRDLSMKIRSAKREKALRGEFVTKNCAFGYTLNDNRKMIIDAEAAETVRLIFEMYAEKKSLVGIAKCLYEEKRPTPAARKKQQRATAMDAELAYVWQKPVLLQILRDEQYLGMYVAGKTRTLEIGNPSRAQVASKDWIRIPDHHPVIISQALFDAVQEQLRVKGEPLRKRDVSTTKRYAASCSSPLKGKVACGHCGHIMKISCTKNAAFHCGFTLPAPGAACHRLRVPKSELESLILKSIKRHSKTIMASFSLSNGIRAPQIPAASEHEAILEKLQDAAG
ncbi:MAG: recombinase family protein, partial [Saezia sp.]